MGGWRKRRTVLSFPRWVSLGVHASSTSTHPAPHTQHPFPSSLTQDAKSGRCIPPSQPSIPRSWVEVTGQRDICRRGVRPRPTPCPQSHQLSGLAGAQKARDGAQNTKEVLPSCSMAEAAGGQTEESRGPHTHPRTASSPLLLFLLLLVPCGFVCFVCLKSLQSKKGGRVQGVGRLLAAAGALGAGERGDLRAGEDKRGSVRRANNGEGVAEDLNFTVCKERSRQVGGCVSAALEGQGRWWRGRQQPAEAVFLSGC